MRVFRLDPATGTKQFPVKEGGCFALGDYKTHGKKQHLVRNRVLVPTEQEMIDLILKGHYVLVEDEVRPNLVRKNLYVDGKQVT